MVDRGRAARYLESLDRLLRDWRDLERGCTPGKLKADRRLGHGVCYVLVCAIQTALDLANMAIAERRLPRPDTYRKAFAILRENRLIRGKKTAELLQELAGFRNVLVHHYIERDWRKVHRNLRRGLPALVAFRKDAARWAR